MYKACLLYTSSLQQAKGTRPEDYRLAYRAGYANLDSPEVLINTRVTVSYTHLDVYKRQILPPLMESKSYQNPTLQTS